MPILRHFALLVSAGAIGGLSATALGRLRTLPERGPPTVSPTAVASASIGAEGRSLRSTAQGMPDAGASVPVDTEAAWKARVDQFQEALLAHEREPLDARWAASTTSSLDDSLRGLAAGVGCDVKRVDCRTTTCIADIEFTSYKQARTGWQPLVTHFYGLKCATELLLETVPQNWSAPYSSHVLWRCQRESE